MNNYEVLYVIDGTLSDEAIKEQVAKFTELVAANGGEVVQVDEWGKRRLAYQINYKSEGYYVLMNFKSEPDFPVELERNFGINESIMRYMVERKPEGYVPPKKAAKPKPAAKPAEAEADKAPAEQPDKAEAPKQEAPVKEAEKAEAKAEEEAPAEAPAEKEQEAPAEEKKEDEKQEK